MSYWQALRASDGLAKGERRRFFRWDETDKGRKGRLFSGDARGYVVVDGGRDFPNKIHIKHENLK